MRKEESGDEGKRKALEKALLDEYALLHVNPAANGVALPRHLASEESVTLKLSKLFRGRLELGASAVEAELLFSGEYFTCVIPYRGIWAVRSESGRFLMWPESAPQRILAEMLQAVRSEVDPAPEQKAGPEQESAPHGASNGSSNGSAPRRAHLTRVK